MGLSIMPMYWVITVNQTDLKPYDSALPNFTWI